MKDTHVRYNDKVYEAIVKFTDDHNISVNSFQNLSATWFLMTRGYVIHKPTPVVITGSEIKVIPEDILYDSK